MTAAMNAADRARQDAMVSGMRAAMQASVEKKQADEASTRAAEREAAALERMKQRYGDLAGSVEKSRRSAEAMGKALRDGSLVRATRDMERFRREEARYRREAELRGRYGDRVGGVLSRLAPAEQAGHWARNKVEGLWSRGLHGTVEQGRREMELNLLGREVASVFKPLTDATTSATRGLRRWMEGLNKSEQNLLMGAGLLGAGALGLLALRGGRLGALGIGGGAAAAGVAGGMGLGDAASMALTAKTLYDMKKSSAPATTPPGGLPPPGSPPPSAPGGASLFSMAGIASLASQAWGGVKWAAPKVPIVAAVAAAAEEASDSEGYYEARKRRAAAGQGGKSTILGSERLANVGHFANSMGDRVIGWFDSDHEKNMRASGFSKKNEEETRRRVAMQGGGFQESGAGYEQIAEAFGKVAATDEGKKGEGEVVKAITEIGKMLAPIIEKAKESAPELRRPEAR
jgi:hypothetical protein